MNRDLLLVAISLSIWGVGEGMFFYFQPLYLQQWGASPLTIGYILGAIGVITVLVLTPAGYLADRYGPRPVMWASWILGTVATIVMALAGSMTVFTIGLFMYGITAFVNPPLNSYVTLTRGKWSVARALTLNSAIYNIGTIIGPILGGYLGGKYGLRSIYQIAAGIFVLSTTFMLFIRPYKNPRPATINPAHRLSKNYIFFGFLPLAFLLIFSTYLPQPLTPNFLQNQGGLSLDKIGQLGTFGNIGNALFTLVLGALSPQWGLIAGAAAVGVFALLMGQGGSFWVYGLGFFFVGGYRLCRSMLMAFTRSLVNSHETGLAYGVLETVNAVAIILAPVVAGLLTAGNPRSVYGVSLALILAVLAASLVFLPILRRAKARSASLFDPSLE